MKRCPVDGTPMQILRRNMVDPARDIFQCEGDAGRVEGDRVHRFMRYDCIDSWLSEGEVRAEVNEDREPRQPIDPTGAPWS